MPGTHAKTSKEKAFDRAVGSRIRIWREARGVSRSKLATSLDPPVTQPNVSYWERGDHGTSLYRLMQICDVLEIRLDWLLIGVSPEGDHHAIESPPLDTGPSGATTNVGRRVAVRENRAGNQR